MDKWSKKKASETCGGLGMSKYIDSNEARRLNRLKNVKSSIGSNMTQHSGWQRQQIEKRRKEQMRQRKAAAKKKPLGDGIQVDTKISKSDAISKCGLKLKVTQETEASRKAQEKKSKALQAQNETQNGVASQEVPQPSLGPNRRRQVPRKPAAAESNLPLLEDRSNVSKSRRPNRTTKQSSTNKHVNGSSQRLRARVDEGKENSDNSTNKEPQNLKNTTSPQVASQKAAASNKKYFMDIDSLRREHADAIKMLAELDKCEGNRRRSLDSDSGNSIDSYASEGSYAPPEQPSYRENNTLDDEFVRDVSLRTPKKDDPTVSDSFLNMTHLSISLLSNIDAGGGADNHENHHGEDEQERMNGTLTPTPYASSCALTPTRSLTDDNEAEVLTPLKNRSFTSSCASIEDDSDFYGDADIDSSSSSGTYSSGTF